MTDVDFYVSSSERGPRKMPPLERILQTHGITDRVCVRCGRRNRSLHRAHIIARVYGGLDNAANMLPLCRECHRQHPDFTPTDVGTALSRAWMCGDAVAYVRAILSVSYPRRFHAEHPQYSEDRIRDAMTEMVVTLAHDRLREWRDDAEDDRVGTGPLVTVQL